MRDLIVLIVYTMVGPFAALFLHDAQNALVRRNVFGAKSIANVAYSLNATGVAMRATDSGRLDIPFSVDIVANVLNGEAIVGCEKPDDIVDCPDGQEGDQK